MYRIPLRVSNIDLDDLTTLTMLDEKLADLAWSNVNGRVIAALIVDCADPVAAGLTAARRIKHALSDVVVHEIDQDLVGVSDIAQRVGVTREAVRHWVDGKRGPGDFPQPVGATSGGERGAVKVWQWVTVAEWVRLHYGLVDEDTEWLSPQQTAMLNAALLRAESALDAAWELSSVFARRFVRDSSGGALHSEPASSVIHNEGWYPVVLKMVHAWHEEQAKLASSRRESQL